MDLKIKDVAKLLNLSETTIRRWLSDGKIPAYRIHGQYRFSRLEVENWMMACKLSSQGEGVFLPEENLLANTSEEVSVRGGMQQFCLYRAIHQGCVLSDIEGKTKEELIRSTTKTIATILNVDADVLAELLIDRERLMPTALNHGVAVPHARDFLHQGPLDMVFVVYPKEPIDYGALDGLAVHTLFFLFAGSDKGHLQLLAKLAHLTHSLEGLNILRSKPNKKELLVHVRQWERDLRPV